MPTDLPECIVTADYAPLILRQDSLVACSRGKSILAADSGRNRIRDHPWRPF